MALDRKAMFAKAAEKRKQEKEESSNRSFWSGEYENTYWMALQTDGLRVFRILGDPLADRHDGSDPKKIFMSRIKADNGSSFFCIWPDRNTDADWILWRIYDLVTKGKMVGSGEARHKVFDYDKTHPECFRRVVYNDRENNQYEKGWYPQAKVIMNVIDRHDPEFHKNVKHTKLLSSKASENSEKPGNFFFEWGVPVSCYNTIWDEVVEYSGDWLDYDICVKKVNSQPYYFAYHGVNDAHKIKEVANLVVDGPLTPEELALERYNLDEMFGVTSYTKIKAKLGNFIKKVDTDFSVNFTKELEALVEKEQAQWKAEGRNQFGYKNSEKPTKHESNNEEVYDEYASDQNAFESAEIPAYNKPKIQDEYTDNRAVAEEVKVRKTSIDWEGLANGSYNGTKYLGINEMTQEEKDMVVSINQDGSFVYKEGLEILKNTKNNFKSPTKFHVDPLSGEIWS